MVVSVELNTSRLTRPLIGCLPRPRTNWDEWDDRMLILNRYWTTKCFGKHYTPLALNQETSTFYDLKLLSFVVTHRESSKNHPYPHLDMSFPSYEHIWLVVFSLHGRPKSGSERKHTAKANERKMTEIGPKMSDFEFLLFRFEQCSH